MRQLLCAVLFAAAVGMPALSGAGVPSSGTLSPLTPVLAYTIGPITGVNPTPQLGVIGMEPTCDVPNGCDDYALTVNVDAAYVAANPDHRIIIRHQWPNSVNDFDVYLQNPTTGTTIQSSASGNNPEQIILVPVAGVTQYRLRVVVFSAANETVSGTITLGPVPVATTAVGSYVASTDVFTCNNHLTGVAGLFDHGGDGEPAIDFDRDGTAWVGGIAGVGAGIGFWKVPFQDECAQQDNFQVQPDAGIGGGDVDVEVAPVQNVLGFYNIYASSLTLANVTHATSFDGGATWVQSFISTPIPVNDRQWYACYGANVLYQSWQEGATQPGNTLLVTRSITGGTPGSFVGGFPVYTDAPVNNTLPKQHGQMVCDQRAGADELTLIAGPNGEGNVYHPFTQNTNEVWMAVSRDFGVTWHSSKVFQGGAADDFDRKFTWAAVDQAGNVYICWASQDAVYYSASTDIKTTDLATWRSPVRVSNGALTKTSVLPMMDAGSAGRLVFAWYGTPAASKDDPSAQWHYYHARTSNALDAVPVIEQVRVSDHVVHSGIVCLDGLNCASGRELLECQELAIDPTDGSSLVSYAGSGGIHLTREVKGVSAIAGKTITDRSGQCPTLANNCVSGPPDPEDQCLPPGVTVLADPPGDVTALGDASTDLRALLIAEPFYPDLVERIVFTMRVEDLDPNNVPPSRLWRIYFTDTTGVDTTFFVSMNSCDIETQLQPSFDFGYVDAATNNLNRSIGTPESGSVLPNGDIQIVMRKTTVGDAGAPIGLVRWYVPLGATLTAVNGDVRIFVGANCSGLISSIDSGTPVEYDVLGNCAATATLVQRFQAEPASRGVDLRWTVQTDGDVVGWHLYRGVDPDGAFDRVTDQPIAMSASGEFGYVDTAAPAGTLWYRLGGIARDGSESIYASTSVTVAATPGPAFEVAFAGANPFRGKTRLHYVLPARDRVKVDVYTVAGRRVATLLDRVQEAGAHELDVTLRDSSGRRLGAGIYLVRVSSGRESRNLRLVSLD